MASLISRLSYSDIFKTKVSVKYLLPKIDFEKSLEFLATINKFEYKINDKKNTDLNFILNDWLKDSNEYFKNQVYNAYSKQVILKNKNLQLQNVQIINKYATLRLIELLLGAQNLINNSKNNKTKSAENLFKLYLLVNNEIDERHKLVFNKYSNSNSIIGKNHKLFLFLGLAKVEMSTGLIQKRLIAEFLKFLLFQKWLTANKEYEILSNTFLEKVGVDDWSTFLNQLFELSNYSINHCKIIIPNSRLKPLLTHFSNASTSNSNWNELLELRKQPIYKLNESEFLVLDSDFLLDKFFTGLYHEIIEISKSSIFNFHQDYNKSFVEEELLCNSIKSVFNNSYKQFSEKNIKILGLKRIENLGIPDYYIRNGNKVFLFECKNSYLSHINKNKLNFSAIEREINEKFYKSGSKGKAIIQLKKFISNTEEKKYQFFDYIKKPQCLKYFPILIVTDYTLCSMGFNKFLNNLFDDELCTFEEKTKKRIAPLTIIHIDDFLFYARHLKKLDRLINNYHAFTSKPSQIEATLSFTQYIENYKLKTKSGFNKKSISHIIKGSLISEIH